MIHKIKSLRYGLLLICLAFATLTINAQTKVIIEKSKIFSVAVENQKLDSKLMARPMPYRVILPKNYADEKSEKYAVIYLLHGLTGHFDNWDEKSQLKNYAADYKYIFVLIEGENGWYTDGAAANDKYESYIIKELIPEIDKNYRTLPDRNHRAVAGLSMGGYGSLKFGFKYPQMFGLVGSFSGALAAASWNEKTLGSSWQELTDSVVRIYGADGSQTRTDNDIFKMVKEITPEKVKNLPFIYQSCGTEDFLIQSNHEYAGLLFDKKIPHEFREHPGIHDWKFWDDQLKEFLETSGEYLKN